MKSPRGDGNALYLDCISVSPGLLYCTTVLQDATIGGNWVKGTRDLLVLFLTPACESTVISK